MNKMDNTEETKISKYENTIARSVSNLFENIDQEKKRKPHRTPMRINVILDGGAFNGSYSLGTLYYLKNLEKHHHISVKRLSGCSVGAFLCVLYLLDDLKYGFHYYKEIRNCFHKHNDLSACVKIVEDILEKITLWEKTHKQSFYLFCKERLYITYFELPTCSQQMSCVFESNSHLCELLLRSCHIPLIVNNKWSRNSYVDGFFPYLFNEDGHVPNTSSSEKNLFVNLFSYNTYRMLYIRGEENNIQRVMTGVLETHAFFNSGKCFHNCVTNHLCSYVENWNVFQKQFFQMRKCMTYILIHCVYFMENVSTYFHDSTTDATFKKKYKLLTRYIRKWYKMFVSRWLV